MPFDATTQDVILLGAAGIALVCAGLVAGLLLARLRRGARSRTLVQAPDDDIKRLWMRLDGLTADVGIVSREIARLSQVPAQTTTVEEQMIRVLDHLGEVRSALIEEQARHTDEERAWSSLHKLEGVLLNAGQRGALGEHIVRQIFAGLPADWWTENFKVNSQVVEFALRLPDDTFLPVDSKFPAPQGALDAAQLPPDDPRRRDIDARLRSAVHARLKDIGKYTDADRSVGFGVLALPDAAYQAALSLIPTAYTTHRAILVPYTLLGPYLLTVYQYHLRSGRNLDRQRVGRAVDELRRHLAAAETQVQQLGGTVGILEGNQKRLRGEIAEIRAALTALERPDPGAGDDAAS